MERGSDKHSARQDDALAHETEGLVRAGRSTHAEEWKDPEPSGEDQPDVDLVPDGTLTGGTPEGMTPEDVERRSALAQALGRHLWPATREEVVSAAQQGQAPGVVLTDLARLPGGREYQNVQEVWEAIGGGVETHRA
ncbi:DUF2795 domain-containing protein [Vallicoccus soli]|uniref:DUF2795 domain-containing protein n=1 Tax=Vallicoccus soli TaxID=2339232 RepID=A0A3A3YU81_9ACTN|nr:DUF2795 domain-containing protein [Vallicoccus soli]RJK93809.1 DUF2795 domain-containing protein [Vallicoccus soli]